jgi:hypothetical protein
MKRSFSLLPFVALGAALSACASSSDKITGSYVSPVQFQNHSCAQLSEEAQRLSSRVAELSGIQDQKASNDALVTGVAIVVFWPAAFLVSGNDQTAAELARLKGEFETIEKVSIQKNCGIQFQKAPPPAREKSARDKMASDSSSGGT